MEINIDKDLWEYVQKIAQVAKQMPDDVVNRIILYYMTHGPSCSDETILFNNEED